MVVVGLLDVSEVSYEINLCFNVQDLKKFINPEGKLFYLVIVAHNEGNQIKTITGN